MSDDIASNASHLRLTVIPSGRSMQTSPSDESQQVGKAPPSITIKPPLWLVRDTSEEATHGVRTPDNCVPDPYYVAPASRSLPVGGWGVFCTNDEGGHWLFWDSTREGAQARADAMNRHRRASHQTIAEARARGSE
jgi:hypothetical protein